MSSSPRLVHGFPCLFSVEKQHASHPIKCNVHTLQCTERKRTPNISPYNQNKVDNANNNLGATARASIICREQGNFCVQRFARAYTWGCAREGAQMTVGVRSVPPHRCAREHKCAQTSSTQVPRIGVIVHKDGRGRTCRLARIQGRACEAVRRGVRERRWAGGGCKSTCIMYKQSASPSDRRLRYNTTVMKRIYDKNFRFN